MKISWIGFFHDDFLSIVTGHWTPDQSRVRQVHESVTSPHSFSVSDTLSTSNLSSAVCALSYTLSIVSLFCLLLSFLQLHWSEAAVAVPAVSLRHSQCEIHRSSIVQMQRRPFHFWAAAPPARHGYLPCQHELPLELLHQKSQGWIHHFQ